MSDSQLPRFYTPRVDGKKVPIVFFAAISVFAAGHDMFSYVGTECKAYPTPGTPSIDMVIATRAIHAILLCDLQDIRFTRTTISCQYGTFSNLLLAIFDYTGLLKCSYGLSMLLPGGRQSVGI